MTKKLRTYKLKIISKHPKFTKIATSYKEAANWLSDIIFNRKKIDNPNKLSKTFYGEIRKRFNLPSQVTCSLFRHVVSTYRSMKSNKQWSLAIYKKPSIPLVPPKDFSKDLVEKKKP
jgi:hypothetical protein